MIKSKSAKVGGIFSILEYTNDGQGTPVKTVNYDSAGELISTSNFTNSYDVQGNLIEQVERVSEEADNWEIYRTNTIIYYP